VSGHRWDRSTWHVEIDRAPGLGIDVKMPWELGRLQHLPQLALAHHHALHGAPGFEAPPFYLEVIEAHLVDFITQNPPGHGVQWGCAMDAAIRVANMLLSYDLVVASSSCLTDDVQSLLAGSVHAHAAFLAANLEWNRRVRTNHYMADLCGLVWAGAHLEGVPEVDSLLCLAGRELQAETVEQFDRDGAGSEGSTSYHRLTAEMVVWTTAVLFSLPEERRRKLQPLLSHLADLPLALQRRPLVASDVTIGGRHLRTVARMADLTLAISRLGTRVTLIGDNDSGRFVKPAPAYRPLLVGDAVARFRNLEGYDRLPVDSVYWWEDSTDHSHLCHAIDGLFGAPAGNVDGAIVYGYLREVVPKPPRSVSLSVQVGVRRPTPAPGRGAARRETLVVPGGDDLLEGLESIAFVDFGLFVWRSARFFLAVRCGPIGQKGQGGHDHWDQLSLELIVDEMPWILDPGNVTYTRNAALRNAYRSPRAHALPDRERSTDRRVSTDLFGLAGLGVAGFPQRYDRTGFVGVRPCSGGLVVRSIDLFPDRIEIMDLVPGENASRLRLESQADAIRLLPPGVPYSPGYGWQERR
jgi:hypothetical protein